MMAIEEREEEVLVRVRVQPKSSRNEIRGEVDGRIRIALTAPPVDGAANKALITFIAKTLGIAKRNIILLQGETSREKTLSIKQCPVTAVLSRFSVDA